VKGFGVGGETLEAFYDEWNARNKEGDQNGGKGSLSCDFLYGSVSAKSVVCMRWKTSSSASRC
jgi:hypothetical protein